MIRLAHRALDAFFARGESSITVPVMDGPFAPNQILEEATVVLEHPGVDNLVVTSAGALLCSSAGDLLQLRAEGNAFLTEHVEHYAAAIACIAPGPDGALAIGFEGGGVAVRGGPFDGRRIGTELRCPAAILFVGHDTIMVANGSASLPPSQWRRDLMNLGRTGSIWQFDLVTGKGSALANGLGFPCGLALDRSSRLCASEAWRHQIIALDIAGKTPPETILSRLPGYPSRIVQAADGGFWLCVFAPRNQLVEFILKEPRYRWRMLAEVPEEDWMAPALASGTGINEPLQWSAIIQMGMMKPWAAGRSYGLLAYLDADFRPRRSYHSRADGVVHGVTAAAEFNGSLLACAKGAGKIVRLPDASVDASWPS